MNIESFKLLHTPMGIDALKLAANLNPREEDFLRHFQIIERRFPAEIVRAALETAILRREAAQKFPFAQKMFFTRQALQQASGWEIAVYRAARYAGFDTALDLGCSIGSDTLALAEVIFTIGLDIDHLRLVMARANAENLGLQNRTVFFRADLYKGIPLRFSSKAEKIACFFDPARRKGERRIFSVYDYHPPLNVINDWLKVYPTLGVKISPGVDLDEVRSYNAEVEFISLHGELKEAVLWFGSFKTTQRRATLLPGRYTICGECPDALPLSRPLAYLYEPDPSILRAGLVALLGTQIGARQLDPAIAYLTSDHLEITPFARVWEIEDWFPFGLKRLRVYLRERGVGRVTIKKRGSPLVPETLIRELRLQGNEERVVFLTQLMGKPIVIVSFPEKTRYE